MTKIKPILNFNKLTSEKQQVVRDRIDCASGGGRLQCAQALVIAKSLHITPNIVGMIADQMGIRIAKCQLGCF